LIQPVLNAWFKRNEIGAAKEAGALTFWRDGMLNHLEAIAAGTATEETFVQLRIALRESEDRVHRSMDKLREARSKLAGTKIGDQIDKVLDDYHFGKSAIRSEIQVVLSLKDKERAQHVCNAIRTLNSELARLNKMANDV
jgi:hypothetical protein